MMTSRPAGKIHILDPATVNKIAAGEVVERPASVVKELVENSVDADAGRIRIDVTSAHGAITGIRVVDDGTGMSPADARLAFTPHATSKIAHASDLDSVTTLGFRGEALASIAAVSRVILSTRERGTGAVAGTKIVIEGGVVMESRETGVPEGSDVLVTDLFFNTPARKKFLKNLPTEIARITGVVEGIALAHPEITFFLTHNGKNIITTEQSAKLIDTVVRIFGEDVTQSMIPVNYRHPFLSINGFISLPSVQRKNQSRIIIAINRRYVSSLVITSAIIEGYGTLLPKDRYPIAFLSLSIDPRLIDVNVHPAKKLVRLSREGQVREIVRDAIRTALRGADLVPSVLTGALPLASPKTFPPVVKTLYDHAPAPVAGISESTHTGISMTDRQLRQTELPTGSEPVTDRIPEMDLIGQFGGIYLLTATAGGDLIIVDQHAAHERILYEQVRARDKTIPLSQELIVPVVLERSARDAAVMRSILPELRDEGFLITEFGRNSFMISAVPVILGKAEEAAATVTDIADDLTREDLKNPVTRREQITRIIACRGAIKAGTVCTGEQCRRLLQQLSRTRNPHTCPHGRPTMIRFSRAELDTLFKRTST
ncbi:MAG: DNA mismatch repair protein [Methanoregula sp. PtaU1.Bin051]|nr:MAG: DNA mismatch repair protein [Methanoregula sp. PtaU1.Bin051]